MTAIIKEPAGGGGASLIERLRSKTRRRDLESGTGWADATGKGGYKSNGEVWQARNPDGEEAADEIEALRDALIDCLALVRLKYGNLDEGANAVQANATAALQRVNKGEADRG